VVFAQAKYINVLDNHHLVVAFVEDSSVDNVTHVLLVALGEEQHRFGIPLRRGQQTLSIRILANALEYRPHCRAHLS
jgi:hypothetical protein